MHPTVHKKRGLLSVAFILFTNALSATIVLPILPLIAVDRFGGSVFQAVAIESIYYGAKLWAAPILGRWSDRVGRRPVLLVSHAGTTLSFGILTLAFVINARFPDFFGIEGISSGIAMLYIGRLLDGLTAGNSTVAKAFMTDCTSGAERADWLGKLSALMGIGFVIGPAICGFSTAVWGAVAPFIIGVGVTGIGLIWALVALQEPAERQSVRPSAASSKPVWSILANPSFSKWGLIAFQNGLCFTALSSVFILYVKYALFDGTVSEAVIGRFVGLNFTMIGLTLAITQGLLLRPIARWLSSMTMVRGGQIGVIISLLLVATMPTRPLFLASIILLTASYAFIEPNLLMLVTQAESDHSQGERIGFFQSITSVSELLGPLYAAILFQAMAPSMFWITSSLFLIPGSMWLVLSERSTKSKTPLKA